MRKIEPRNVARWFAVVVAAGVVSGVGLAADPPDSEVNPRTGYIESVYIGSQGSGSDIRHSIDTGPGR